MQRIKIFLSYSWANKKIADKIYNDLTLINFEVIKDDHVLKYTDNISNFMNRIRETDFVLLLICDSYLKSINCMREVMQIQKDDNAWKKILPVICKNTNFYEVSDRINYVNYWEEKSSTIETSLKKLDPINSNSLNNELKMYKEIAQRIESFLYNLKEQLNVSPDDLFENYYSAIIERIGVDPDFTKIVQIIPISYISDPKLRLTAINNFATKNKIEHSSCYSIIASCYRDLKNPKKAIQNYKKAIALDDFNYSAWNNLGQVYELELRNYSAARRAYEKAISSKPDFDIARLNLGCILSNYFDDAAGAKAQYEAILEFDENNAKAHNNLGNLYKFAPFFDLDKAEEHLIIAANQNNLEALLSYANFLKFFKKNMGLGNCYYQKAKLLDIENKYTEIIDVMLKSTKG